MLGRHHLVANVFDFSRDLMAPRIASRELGQDFQINLLKLPLGMKQIFVGQGEIVIFVMHSLQVSDCAFARRFCRRSFRHRFAHTMNRLHNDALKLIPQIEETVDGLLHHAATPRGEWQGHGQKKGGKMWSHPHPRVMAARDLSSQAFCERTRS